MEAKAENESLIVRSPFAYLAEEIVVPNVSYPEFLFDCLRKNMKLLKDRVAVVDALRDQSLFYKDIEPMAIRFASALTKRGFKKGDVFYYVTYNSALLFALQFGVELCGGAVRGCYQKEELGEMEKQMRETNIRFILCEPETAELVKTAAGRLGWPVTYFSIDGNVEGASPVEEMANEDDGSAYNKDLVINPEEDIMFIPTTSGSTGNPKGALHTHRNMVAFQACCGAPFDLESANWKSHTHLVVVGNFNVGPTLLVQNSLVHGDTMIIISRFDKDSFFRFFDWYKPSSLGLFVYIANIVTRSPELESRDVSIVEKIVMGGSVTSPSVIDVVRKKFPHAKLDAMYGMTEALGISSSDYGHHYTVMMDPAKEAICKYKVLKLGSESYVSSGVLLPLVEAKVVDVESGKAVERGVKGRLLVRSPFLMKGYLKSSEKQGYKSVLDENGWLDTGDLACIDDDGHIYVIERLNMIFKYFMHMVSPADIEGVILQHPSVQSVGVVGVPNPETTSAARAYVVIKPGCRVAEDEIKQLVADNMPFYKHLHGGIVFKDKLPESRAGKLDRAALLRQAIQEIKSSS